VQLEVALNDIKAAEA